MFCTIHPSEKQQSDPIERVKNAQKSIEAYLQATAGGIDPLLKIFYPSCSTQKTLKERISEYAEAINKGMMAILTIFSSIYGAQKRK